MKKWGLFKKLFLYIYLFIYFVNKVQRSKKLGGVHIYLVGYPTETYEKLGVESVEFGWVSGHNSITWGATNQAISIRII